MNIPLFCPNTPDNTHCFQACIKMLLKEYFPSEEYSWNELEQKTAKVEGLWTWPMAGLLWLSQKEIEVKVIWKFKFESFIQQGGDYLIERYGERVGNEQIAHSNIEQERHYASEFIKNSEIENRVATNGDIERLLDEGYLLICNIDLGVLNNVDKFLGHFVLIYGYDDENYLMHDPGLPPRESRKVKKDLFNKSWGYSADSESVMAFRKKI